MHLLFPKDINWKKFLIEELKRDCCPSEVIKNHKDLPLVSLPDSVDLKKENIAFSLDCIPDAETIAPESIGNQVTQLLSSKRCQVEFGSLTVQVFGISEKYGILHTGRCEILAEKIYKQLKKTPLNPTRKFKNTDFLLKVLIMPDRSLRFGLYDSEEKQEYFSLLSPFPGGFTTITDDKAAPSRAFKKLVEAQEIFGSQIQKKEELLDLGACPGGWSYVALEKGATVSAVDRSEVDPKLLHDSNLEFHEADAFKFEGRGEYDWVVSDIICAPERILELINKWAIAKKCKYFVFTIKFKGDDYKILSKFKEVAKKLSYQVILRQLNVNKNEVMILGREIP